MCFKKVCICQDAQFFFSEKLKIWNIKLILWAEHSVISSPGGKPWDKGIILQSGWTCKCKAICRKFTVLRNATSIFGKGFFYQTPPAQLSHHHKKLPHNHPTTTLNQTCTRWYKIVCSIPPTCLRGGINSFIQPLQWTRKILPSKPFPSLFASGQLCHVLLPWRKSWGWFLCLCGQ